jgi:hypothetical protein
LKRKKNGNQERKREFRGIIPSGQRAAVYPTLVDLSEVAKADCTSLKVIPQAQGLPPLKDIDKRYKWLKALEFKTYSY